MWCSTGGEAGLRDWRKFEVAAQQSASDVGNERKATRMSRRTPEQQLRIAVRTRRVAA